jgi:hypothetical protein
MAVYGNMLAAFPELMRNYEVFKMAPRIGAGYNERHDKRTVRGYMSWRKSREMGIEGDARMRNDRGTFWEQHHWSIGKSQIEQGDYVELKNRLFIFVEDDDFGMEGGFSRWLIQQVSGNTDRQVTNTKVDEAIRNDYE